MEKNKIVIEMTAQEAEQMSNNFADLLCWWQGFNYYRKLSGDHESLVAEHGIEELSKFNSNLRETVAHHKDLPF